MPINIRQQAIYIRSGDPATENEPIDLYPGQLGMRVTTKEPWNPAFGAGAGSGASAGAARGQTGSAAQPQFREETWQKERVGSASTEPSVGAGARREAQSRVRA